MTFYKKNYYQHIMNIVLTLNGILIGDIKVRSNNRLFHLALFLTSILIIFSEYTGGDIIVFYQ